MSGEYERDLLTVWQARTEAARRAVAADEARIAAYDAMRTRPRQPRLVQRFLWLYITAAAAALLATVAAIGVMWAEVANAGFTDTSSIWAALVVTYGFAAGLATSTILARRERRLQNAAALGLARAYQPATAAAVERVQRERDNYGRQRAYTSRLAAQIAEAEAAASRDDDDRYEQLAM